MIYLKTILYVLLFLLIANSPIFVTYYNIKYDNLVLIIVPIIGIIFLYSLLKYSGVKRFNPVLFKLNLNTNHALFIALLCNILVILKFDISKFISGDIYSIRSDFNQFNVGTMDQILPVLMVYPAIYVLWVFGVSKIKKNWKFYSVVFCLILYGLSTGGRAFIFIFLTLY